MVNNMLQYISFSIVYDPGGSTGKSSSLCITSITTFVEAGKWFTFT